MASAAALGVDKVINLKLSDSVYGGTAAYDASVASVKSKIKAPAQQYPGQGAAYTLNIPSAHMKIKRNAIYAYNTWDPSRNLYALGYHSVPERLEGAHSLPYEYVYTLPNSSYQYGRITTAQRSWS